jgi:hypothetical protein
MNIIRIAFAVSTLSVLLSLQAQTPPPPPPPANGGPTLEQTIAFIQRSLLEQGFFHFHVHYNNPANEVYLQTHQAQTISLSSSAPCTIDYGDNSTRLTLDLSSVDPRSVRVITQHAYTEEGNPVSTWTQDPAIYVVTIRFAAPAGSPFVKRNPILAYFLDESLTGRVAKAYIHAIALCQKPGSVPLF